jgi:hypothetical protein
MLMGSRAQQTRALAEPPGVSAAPASARALIADHVGVGLRMTKVSGPRMDATVASATPPASISDAAVAQTVEGQLLGRLAGLARQDRATRWASSVIERFFRVSGVC